MTPYSKRIVLRFMLHISVSSEFQCLSFIHWGLLIELHLFHSINIGQIGLYAGNYIGLMKNHVIGCFSSECEISNDGEFYYYSVIFRFVILILILLCINDFSIQVDYFMRVDQYIVIILFVWFHDLKYVHNTFSLLSNESVE